MTEITFSNYKFKFTLNDTILNIQIANIINNNLFEGSIYEFNDVFDFDNNKYVHSINKFYNMIINGLNKRENFNVKINEEDNLITVFVNYDTNFTNLEEFFTLNKLCGLENDVAILKKRVEQLEDNETVLYEYVEWDQNKYHQLYKNNVYLSIIYNAKNHEFCCSKNGVRFYNWSTINEIAINGFSILPRAKSRSVASSNCPLYIMNYANIVIYVEADEYSNTMVTGFDIHTFLQKYSEINKHIINKILVTGSNYQNKILVDIIKTLGTLTNYKELHINDNQLENHCKTNNIKFVKI